MRTPAYAEGKTLQPAKFQDTTWRNVDVINFGRVPLRDEISTMYARRRTKTRKKNAKTLKRGLQSVEAAKMNEQVKHPSKSLSTESLSCVSFIKSGKNASQRLRIYVTALHKKVPKTRSLMKVM